MQFISPASPTLPRRLAALALLSGAAVAAVGCSLRPASAQGDPVPYTDANVEEVQKDARPPKNVIVMIGDGMGFNHLALAEMHDCGKPGCRTILDGFDRLAMSTYPEGGAYDPQKAWNDPEYVFSGSTDSAAAGTALATGRKTRNGALGVLPDGTPVENVFERAEASGRSTGVVTTVPFSHATPAAYAAHCDNRGKYADIARAMLENSGLEVIMGAGHPDYDDNGAPLNWSGQLAAAFKDRHEFVGGADLWEAVKAGTAGGDMNADGTPDPWTLVEDREGFRALAEGTLAPARVLGVPRTHETLQQKRDSADGEPDDDAPGQTPPVQTVPTLPEMTAGALNVLKSNPRGFALMIEGGAIDWAGHANQLGRAVEETSDFLDAIETVVNWVESGEGWDDTLLIITADHETGGLWGPGKKGAWQPLVSNGAGKLPAAQWNSDGHTNSLVPFLVRGNGADLFRNIAAGEDPSRAAYLDNTDVARVLFALFGEGGGKADSLAEAAAAPAQEGK